MRSLLEIAGIFFRLGATAFGGPLAHIALMRTEFVERRKWLSEQEFLDLSGAVNLIPGPNSTELAMHIGHARGGMRGLFVAGFCFIFPAFVMVLVLAHLYMRFGTLPAAQAILWGVSPVVVAVVAQALWKFAPTALKSRLAQIVAGFALLLAIVGISEIVLIFAAAALGLAFAWIGQGKSKANRDARSATDDATNTQRDFSGQSAFLLLGAGASSSLAGAVFFEFLKMGCLVYGSGYVLLVYLRAELVEKQRWISEQTLLDAISVGQVTPGPVFTSATFLGFQIAGFWGAIAATLGIFAPSFVFVALLSSALNRLKNSPKARVFLDCVNAASFVLMALVTLQLARAALFSGGVFDPFSAFILAISGAVLLFLRLNSAFLLVGGAALGLVLRQISGA